MNDVAIAELAESDLTPLDDVKAGAVLGSDLRDAKGMVLLSAGTQLTESSIASLRRRGVTQVPLAASAHLLSEDEWKDVAADLRRRVGHLFRYAGQGETVDRLRELVFGYRLSKLYTPRIGRSEDQP